MSKFVFSGGPWLLAIAAALGLGVWAPAGSAAQSCLLDSDNKVCLTVTALPGETVQPSQLGGTTTYVTFVAELQNIVRPNSSRFVSLNVDLAPASLETYEFTTSPGLTCTRTGTAMQCTTDKLGDKFDGGDKRTLRWTVKAPTEEGLMVANAVFGWNGRTSSASTAVAVNEASGGTVVPAGHEATIVTSPAGPTGTDPLYAKIFLPAKPYDYSATVRVIDDGPELMCTGGLFLSVTDGGPYVCREDDPGRWIELDIDLPVEHESDSLLYRFEMQWDETIMAAAQLPPTPVAPTGTPPFAVFYAENSTPPPAAFRAFSAQCANNANTPPCFHSVQEQENGDWLATGIKYSDNPNDAITAAGPLAPFYAMLEFLLNSADAGTIDPPDVMR